MVQQKPFGLVLDLIVFMNNEDDNMNNNDGFTLIELIGVISIISILSLLFFPNLIYQFKNTDKKMDNQTEQIIIDSAKLYVENNLKSYNKANTYCISISDLIENEYLEDNFTEYNKEKIIENKVVQAIGNGKKFNFSIVDSNKCNESE